MFEGLLRVDHAPGHGRCAGAVLADEAHGERAFLGIENVVDVALAPDGDRLGLVAGHRLVAHAGKQASSTFGSGWANSTNSNPSVPAGLSAEISCARCVVRERTHVSLLVLSALLMLAAALVDCCT
jgi:hypothetical protein